MNLGSKRMDAEKREMMPTMDVETNVQRVVNALKEKLGKIIYFKYRAISIVGNIIVTSWYSNFEDLILQIYLQPMVVLFPLLWFVQNIIIMMRMANKDNSMFSKVKLNNSSQNMNYLPHI